MNNIMAFEMDTTDNNPDDIKALLDAFGRCSRIAEVMMRELWDAEDVAVYLKASTHTVINKYSKSETWPRAVGGGEMKKMWKRDEVIAWAMRRAA
jgi:hypothetical protein